MKNQIIEGDCLIEMQKIEDKSIDMVLTSPPYDNLRTYNGSLDWGEHIWKPVIQELFRIIKDGGVVVWVVGDATIKGSETGTSFKQALYFKEIGFNLHDTMIYKVKGTGAKGSRYCYWQEFEYMFIFSKGKPKTINFLTIKRIKQDGGSRLKKDGTKKIEKRKNVGELIDSKIGNVWEYSVGGGPTGHPAIFPEKLAEDHILSWSNEGDTILDPMAGSGTVGKVAKQLNRNYILIEKEPEYVKIINERLK